MILSQLQIMMLLLFLSHTHTLTHLAPSNILNNFIHFACIYTVFNLVINPPVNIFEKQKKIFQV